MEIKIQAEVYSILIITTALCILGIVLGNAVKKMDPAKAPSGAGNVGVVIVNFFDDFVRGAMGNEYVKNIAPLVGSIGIYIWVSNLIGLISLPSPTGNFSVTVTLAFIAWLLIEGTQVHVKGWKEYFKGFLSPLAVFLPMNIISCFSPILSMGMRLFGNILVGGILMGLVYSATSLASSLFPLIGQVNFLGPIFAPLLHAFFDVFQGTIQMYIFITLMTNLAKSKSE